MFGFFSETEIRLHELSENSEEDAEELTVIRSLIDEIRFQSCISLPLQIIEKPDRKEIGSNSFFILTNLIKKIGTSFRDQNKEKN